MKKTILALSYIRAVFHWFWLVFGTLLCITCILFFEILGNKKKSYQATRLWGFSLLRFCGIKVKSKNTQNIPEKPFLIMFNHRSYVDILALFQATPVRFHFGAKKSLFSIPIMGFAMKKAGHISIERSNPKEVYRLYNSLTDRVKRGDCFALAPEGGRHIGSGLGRFKKGPFVFALQHQVTILPVIIHKAEVCMPKGSLFFNIGKWKRTVIVEYLPVVKTKGMSKDNIKELQEQIHESMASHLT